MMNLNDIVLYNKNIFLLILRLLNLHAQCDRWDVPFKIIPTCRCQVLVCIDIAFEYVFFYTPWAFVTIATHTAIGIPRWFSWLQVFCSIFSSWDPGKNTDIWKLGFLLVKLWDDFVVRTYMCWLKLLKDIPNLVYMCPSTEGYRQTALHHS